MKLIPMVCFKNTSETGVLMRNEIYSYITEGIGEDILPET
jgi:cystathionine beta-synthase